MKKKKSLIISTATIGLFLLLLLVIVISATVSRDGLQIQDINSPLPLPPSQEERPEVGHIAPDFTLYDMDGKKVSLSEHKGKVIFLNVWATWCGPCLAEMPAMEKLHNQFKSEKFIILAVSVDTQGMEVVKPYIEKLGTTFPVLLDTEDLISSLYQVFSIPETLIIDKNGIIVSKIMVARDWSSEKSFEAIEYLINN